MTILNPEVYRTAFVEYLRKGTPIHLSLKQARITDQYVWRTQRDKHVRRSHRMNDGRVFSRDDQPDTGHPGEDYNCRCERVPFVAGETEFGFHELTMSFRSSGDRWSNLDFVRHYYNGGGRSVTLLDIGHLREVAEQYAYDDGTEGAFRRLTDQIVNEARAAGAGSLSYDFGAAYDFGDVAFSHGDGVVRGAFVGRVEDLGAMLRINGKTNFEFSDIFEDPLNIGIEAGGTPYPITGNWTARFSAEVMKDAGKSEYGGDSRE